MACLIPDEIVAGTTLDLLLTLTAIPAPDWALSLILRGPSAITLGSAASGAQHRIGASAAVTHEWLPGVYDWALRASRGAEVVQIDTGILRVRPDIVSLPAGHDGRSHAARVVEAIEAVLEKRATTDQQKYTINNRELWRTPIPELLLLRDRYRAEMRREEQARRGGQSLLGRQIKVRF